MSDRILIACERTGAVRDAFIERGLDAVSCDLRPSASPGPHIIGDALDVVYGGAWRMLIAFPPCTYLAASGLHWNNRRPGRAEKTAEALAFVRRLWDAPIVEIAIENPVGVISRELGPPSQSVHPWQFGHAEAKRTCFWLRGLLPLEPTQIIRPRAICVCGHRFESDGSADCERCGANPTAFVYRFDNQTGSGQNRLSKGIHRADLRARTYPGIASAMADQWGLGKRQQLGLF